MMQKFAAWKRTGRPLTPDERAFCAQWLERRLAIFLKLSYAAVFCSHALSFALAPRLTVPPVSDALALFHGSMAVLAALGGLAWQRPRLHKVVMCLLLILTSFFYLGLTYYAAHFDNTPQNVLLALLGAVLYAIFGLQTYPGNSPHAVVWATCLSAFAFVALGPVEGGTNFAALFSLVLPLALILRGTASFIAHRAALSEYRFRVRIAPAHIVRRAKGDETQLDEMFKPRLSLCVCLSSDWRNYQQLSAHISPETLGAAIDAYYELCQTILQKHLPHGNYYTDWIADELFVVLYPEEGIPTEGMVDAALQFAHALVAAKQGFVDQHGLPKAIDIGISYGEALLGLMGPSGHKKATALGEVPGRARRLQSAGKLLRRHLGEGDRIVFGPECLKQVSSAFQVGSFALPTGTNLRDVEDREIYYVEPGAGPVERSA